MKDEFNNRLTAFSTTLQCLNSDANKPIWENMRPIVLTTKVGLAVTAVADLRLFCEEHGLLTTGSTLDKAREEAELELAAFEVGKAAADFFHDHGNEAEAAQVEFSEWQWRRWSGNTLLANARVVEGKVRALTLGADAAVAASYGLDALALARVKKEADDYEGVLNAPDVAIGNRAVLTRQMRSKFAAVETIFDQMDRLVVQFRNTAAGKTFVEAYFQARQIIDRGHGPGLDEPVAPTPTP